MFSGAIYSLPSYPNDQEVESDMTNNWTIPGEQGKLLSVKKIGKWEKKVIFKEKVKYLIGFIKYSAQVEFDSFIRNFEVHVVYILEQGEWIYDKNEIIKHTDEQKKGEKQFTKDEIKEKIKVLMEKQDQEFMNFIYEFQKKLGRNVELIKAPVKVNKVLIAAPEIKGSKTIYLCDIDLQDSEGNNFTIIDMKYEIWKKDSNSNEWNESFTKRHLGSYNKK